MAAEAIDELSPELSSMWRLCKPGYRHKTGLVLVSHRFSTVRMADVIVRWMGRG